MTTEFTEATIESVQAKLDQWLSSLDENEQVVVLALFHAAAAGIADARGDTGGYLLPATGRQITVGELLSFVNSFAQTDAARLLGEAGQRAIIVIGGRQPSL
ncbi:MAG: hypothetical protein HYX51_06190 [Chloroflexi bacterium]|nr:hypothetical protein [Chloroflexota bacterium]